MNLTSLRCRVAAFFLVGTLVQVACAEGPEAPSPVETMDPSHELTSISDWDAANDAINKLAWQIHDVSRSRKDVAGNSLDQYWDQYILLPEAKARIDALHERAQKQSEAGDTKGLQATLAEASPLVNAEKYKTVLMVAFASGAGSLVYQRETLRPWTDRGTDADRAAADAQAQAGQAALVEGLSKAMKEQDPDLHAATRFVKSANAHLKALNEQRLRLVGEQSQQPNPSALEALTRDTACPPDVAPRAGQEKPGLAPDFPSLEDYYPPLAKLAQMEGPVTVRVTISDTGCVVRAELVGTSGARDLDQGALALAMAGSYIPASKDGKAVPGAFPFRVKFELRD